MVDVLGLGYPGPGLRSVSYGVDITLDHLGHALDWVADHTPADPETLYYEATVTYYHNTHGPTTVVLRSHDRPVAEGSR
jgi:hypothetical protein